MSDPDLPSPLDPVIHAEARLRVMTTLAAVISDMPAMKVTSATRSITCSRRALPTRSAKYEVSMAIRNRIAS